VQTPYRVSSRLWFDRGLGDVAWCCIAEENLSVGIFPDRRNVSPLQKRSGSGLVGGTGGPVVAELQKGDRAIAPWWGAATILREGWQDRRSASGAKKNIPNPQVWNWK